MPSAGWRRYIGCCNTLQHTATHCKSQRTAARRASHAIMCVVACLWTCVWLCLVLLSYITYHHAIISHMFMRVVSSFVIILCAIVSHVIALHHVSSRNNISYVHVRCCVSYDRVRCCASRYDHVQYTSPAIVSHYVSSYNNISYLYHMGWLRLVGSSNLQVSFAKEPY